MRRSLRLGSLASVLAAALLVAGCQDDTPSPTTPTDPVLVTTTFNGTLTMSGGVTFPFAIGSSGPVTATLTTLADTALVVGISLGAWDGSSCAVAVARDTARQGDAVTAEASQAGNLCVRIYDVGNLTDSQTFQLDVRHP
jgi:hypothetical protein